jgi:hypothetical protein
MSTQISQFFTYNEAVFSQTAARLGYANIPNAEIMANINATALRMDSVRILLGQPILVSSWYRSLPVNRAIGSKDSSQHTKGQAVDFTSPRYGLPVMVFEKIAASEIKFDQLILEYDSWVHISFTSTPRGQKLIIDNRGTRNV